MDILIKDLITLLQIEVDGSLLVDYIVDIIPFYLCIQDLKLLPLDLDHIHTFVLNPGHNIRRVIFRG